MSQVSSSGPAHLLSASVIVCAHDRRSYLRAAVESVLEQDLPRSRFEVVVVKNFDDAELDPQLDAWGVHRILCRAAPASLKVAAGLRASRGEVALLLDDDDLFEPHKLRTVLREFQDRPEVGFYHNQVSYIGPTGEPLDPGTIAGFGLRPAGRAHRRFVANSDKANGLSEIAFHYPDFNASSIAIRRTLALSSLPYLERLEGGVDTFLFFLGLVSPYALLLDDARLTRYRVHETNSSLWPSGDSDARRKLLLEAARRQSHVNQVTRSMVEASGNSPALREIDARILVTQLAILFRDRQSRRADAARALLRAVGLRRTFAFRENVPSVAGALLFAVAPGLARTTYEHHMAIR